jgi:hypothetical protein
MLSPTSSTFTRSSKRRRSVAALGAELIGKLSYYERWIVVFANILFQKGVLTPVLVGPGDIVLTRVWRSLRSRIQLRENARIAAFDAA